MWASQNPNVLNASVEFDEKTLKPTYKLLVGVAGASAGLEIARRMNVPVEVIEFAKTQLNPLHTESSNYLKQLKALVDEQESLRAALEEERQVTAAKYAQLDLDFARRENERRKEFEHQLSEVIREFSAESDKLLRAIQDKVVAAKMKNEAEARAAELRRSAGVRLRKQATASSPVLGGSESTKAKPEESPASLFEQEIVEIRERDRVRINSLGQEGVVESVSGGTYTILIGSLRFRAKREELKLLQSAVPLSKAVANLPSGVSASLSIDSDMGRELNIIGSTVDEAEPQVDRFLDAAFLAGLESVRIVHGHGKGALRQAVTNLLKGHPHVQSFAPAPANEGGAGATIAVLKK